MVAAGSMIRCIHVLSPVFSPFDYHGTIGLPYNRLTNVPSRKTVLYF